MPWEGRGENEKSMRQCCLGVNSWGEKLGGMSFSFLVISPQPAPSRLTVGCVVGSVGRVNPLAPTPTY